MTTDNRRGRPRRPTTSYNRAVRITIGSSNFARIHSYVPELLPYFTDRRVFSELDSGPTGYRLYAADVRLWKKLESGMGIAPGMVPRALDVLKAHGYRAVVTDQRKFHKRFRPDSGMLETMTDEERELIEAVDREPLGRIEIDTQREAVGICKLICDAYPLGRIAFAVARAADACELWKVLQGRVDEKIGLSAREVNRQGPRLLVSTIAGLPRSSINGWDALVLPYGEDVTCESHVRTIVEIREYDRRYVCVVKERATDDLGRLCLEAVGGPVIRSLAPRKNPVTVVMVRVDDNTIEVVKDASALERKRSLYWSNRIRNQCIVRIAKALADQDWGRLTAFGLTAADVLVSPSRGLRVVILVESTEHARNLATSLPEWSVCDGTSRSENRVKPTRSVQKPELRIVTSTFAHKHGIRADVVIRATGTDSPLRASTSTEAGGVCRTTIVVDFLDAEQPISVSHTKARIQDYKASGMNVVTATTNHP